MADAAITEEQHPYFPSGVWEGFFVYGAGPGAERHQMSFSLNFSGGRVTGSGGDSVGAFSWEGTYDVAGMSVTMTKTYVGSHSVHYRGMADATGIYGSWTMIFTAGGFHIWPKDREEIVEEATVEEKELSAV